MTGKKDRYSTTEKLWNLDDEQLTTPRHDEMVIDVITNGKTVFDKFGNAPKPWSSFEISEYYRTHDTWTFNRPVDYDRVVPTEELTIRDYSGHTNATFTFDNPDGFLQHSASTNELASIPSTQIKSEIPLSARNGFLVGFLDILLETERVEKKEFAITSKIAGAYKYTLNQYVTVDQSQLGIEVKPTIPSFGQTLRQLNTYREYFKGELMLYTDDTRYKAAFESQGIRVLSSEDIMGILQ